jgi:hypothetical protein
LFPDPDAEYRVRPYGLDDKPWLYQVAGRDGVGVTFAMSHDKAVKACEEWNRRARRKQAEEQATTPLPTIPDKPKKEPAKPFWTPRPADAADEKIRRKFARTRTGKMF